MKRLTNLAEHAMRIYEAKMDVFFVLIVFMLFMGGCGGPINLIKSGVYGVEESTPSGITISKVTAYQDKDDFVISGKLIRSHRNISYPGHVDIAIVAPNGDILGTTSVKNKLPFVGRSKRKTSSLKAKFTSTPPDGSQIRVSFHRKGATGSNQFNCTSNQAIED